MELAQSEAADLKECLEMALQEKAELENKVKTFSKHTKIQKSYQPMLSFLVLYFGIRVSFLFRLRHWKLGFKEKRLNASIFKRKNHWVVEKWKYLRRGYLPWRYPF